MQLQIETNDARSRVCIVPGRGFNCVSWKVYDSRFGDVEIIDTPPEFFTGKLRPAAAGVPLLFPFPNRIRGGRFNWEGVTYQLDRNEANLNAIHGFVLDRPWRVVQHQQSRITGEFQLSTDAPELIAHWPADFVIRVTYSLQSSSLRADIEVVNPGETPLPWGFGTHSYFRTPWLAGSDRGELDVTVPAQDCWELKDLLPTGVRSPVQGRNDLRNGCRLGTATLDDVLTSLIVSANRNGRQVIETVIQDRHSGRRIVQSTGPEFRELVAYTPPHHRSVCLEPYTCVTDAINLQQQGVDAGLRVLPAGQSADLWFEFRYDELVSDR